MAPRAQIQALPANVLAQVLLGAHSTRTASPHELLLRVAAIAQVCRDWRATVLSSALYGLPVTEQAGRPRAQLLALITRGLRRALESSVLSFRFSSSDDPNIGFTGAKILAAAVSAGAPLPLKELRLVKCGLNAESLALLAPAFAYSVGARTPPSSSAVGGGDGDDHAATSDADAATSRLRVLDVSQNPALGDAGVLNGLVPLLAGPGSELETLRVDTIGCGDAGIAAVAERLPRTLRTLSCSGNGVAHMADRADDPRADPVPPGVAALLSALPELKQLKTLAPAMLTYFAPQLCAAKPPVVVGSPPCNPNRSPTYAPTSPSYDLDGPHDFNSEEED
jgi:hypothetical protein